MKKLTASILVLIFCGGCATTHYSPVKPQVPKRIEDAIAKLPDNSVVKVAAKKGMGYMIAGEYDKANSAFSEGLRLDPQHGQLHFLNALSYHLLSTGGDTSKVDLAESGYLLALKYDPSNHWAAYHLGHIYFSKKRYIDAQNQFSYGLLYKPNCQHLLRALSVASYYAENIDIGLWASEKALKGDQNNSSNIRNALFNKAARGDFSQASVLLKNYQTKRSGHLSELAHKALSNRIDQWRNFHVRNKNLLAQRSGSVFGTKSDSEGKLLNLSGDDNGSSYTPSSTSRSYAPKNNKQKRRRKLNLPKMTLIDVVILRTEESRAQNKGINLLSGLQATLGGTAFGYSNQATGGAKELTVAPTLTLAGLKYNFNIFNDGVNKAQILARPSLLAVEGQTSKFSSGAILHVQLSSQNVDGSMIDLPIGIEMVVTPTFYDEETVKVEVSAKRSFLESNSEKVGFTAFTQTSNTSVKSTAVLRFGETLILSGLSENENETSKDGVPFLQSLPFIQYFFSNKQELKTKKSVLILLTPHKARFSDNDLSPSELRTKISKRKEQKRYVFELEAREKIARNNIDAALQHLEHSNFFTEFRTGDLQLDVWHNQDSFFQSVARTLEFLWY